jgi:hypothetical protein
MAVFFPGSAAGICISRTNSILKIANLYRMCDSRKISEVAIETSNDYHSTNLMPSGKKPS